MDDLKLWANVEILEHDLEGRLLDRIIKKNLVVANGVELLTSFLSGDSIARPTHLAVGTGNTAIISTTSSLANEVFRGQLTQRDDFQTYAQLKYYLSPTQANGNDLKEAGLFTASSGGTLFAAITHPTKTKSDQVTLTYTWKVRFSVS